MLTQLATHVLTNDADPQDLQFWRMALSGLKLLPCLALIVWLLLSLALSRLLQQEPLSMLGQAASDVGAIERVDAEAKRLRVEISRKRLRPTLKDKISLHMQFAFFLVDYASDCNCLAQMLLEQRYSVAIAQALMIVLPVALDCYRGKIQLVEVIGGFLHARKTGFPTNSYIEALRSEKSVEAPLSLCLQYYTLLTATRFRTVWGLLLSMPLSVANMATHVYNSFELSMYDVVVDDVPPPVPQTVHENPTPAGGFQRRITPDTSTLQTSAPVQIGYTTQFGPHPRPPPATRLSW